MQFEDSDDTNPDERDDIETDDDQPSDAVEDQDDDRPDDTDDEYDDDDDEDELDDQAEQPAHGNASAELEELVKFIASRLVHEADQIEVDSEYRGGTVYISLRVPESEMGRVIGREGRTAKAIRTLVSIAGSRYNVHARLDIDG